MEQTTLQRLTDVSDPAWPHVQQMFTEATNSIEVLLPPPQEERNQSLLGTGVTLRSTLGAIVYHTGGLLIDGGWVRVLGAGHPRLPRSLPVWNSGRASGFMLVADDVVGGFFALDGGAFAAPDGNAFYFAPDSLRWEPIGTGYSGLIRFLCSGDIALFYKDMRWPGWREEIASLRGDQALSLYPFPWTVQGKDLQHVSRKPVPIAEVFSMSLDIAHQLDAPDESAKPN
ncbi:MAG: DUF2625 family protein [Phycisphaerales bacterium]